MKAITVKYLPQTNHKPARLKAFDSDGNQVTVTNADNLDAVRALCAKMRWRGTLVSGGQRPGVEVFVWKHGDTYEV